MDFKVGEKVLLSTDGWFYTPEGTSCRAVWGTLHGVYNSEDFLGIKTNDKSTNWYVQIGDMIVAGCAIHYAIRCERPNLESFKSEYYSEHLDRQSIKEVGMSRIYNADKGR